MNFLTDKELQFVSSLDGQGQQRLDTSIHEAGHAIITIHFGGSFNLIKRAGSFTGESPAGYLDGLTLPDNHTIRQYVSVGLGGWAALEVFCCLPIDIMNHIDFGGDLMLIQMELARTEYTLERALFEIQPQTKEIMMRHIGPLKKMAFALFGKGELSYQECKTFFTC